MSSSDNEILCGCGTTTLTFHKHLHVQEKLGIQATVQKSLDGSVFSIILLFTDIFLSCVGLVVSTEIYCPLHKCGGPPDPPEHHVVSQPTAPVEEDGLLQVSRLEQSTITILGMSPPHGPAQAPPLRASTWLTEALRSQHSLQPTLPTPLWCWGALHGDK